MWLLEIKHSSPSKKLPAENSNKDYVSRNIRDKNLFLGLMQNSLEACLDVSKNKMFANNIHTAQIEYFFK